MYRIKRLEFWLVIAVVFLFATGFTSAAPLNAKTKMAVSNSLNSQIKKDFADQNINVEITRFAQMNRSIYKQSVFGDAFMKVGYKVEKQPIFFEATVNRLTNQVLVIDYTYIENESQINTDFLQRLVIKKIGNDYETKEVAATIDNVELVNEVGNTEKFRGYGEVRIGSLIWKKIKFEITLDKDSERVLYKLYKM